MQDNGLDLERTTALISLSKKEKERLTWIAKTHGFSLSAFLRIAAEEYIRTHEWDEGK